MKAVRVNKTDLLGIIKKNREQHKLDYESAVVNYNSKLIEALNKALDKMASIGKLEIGEQQEPLARPRQYLDDYDRAIRMLELSLDEEVTLDVQEFNQYVLDQWAWQHTFTASTKSYNGVSK